MLDYLEHTSMYGAAENDRVDAISLLIDVGANIDVATTSWDTALHHAARGRQGMQ